LANIREILSPGEDALFFEAGDANDMARAIEELASDPERVRCMGYNARQTIETRRYYWLDNARRAVELVGLGSKLEAAPTPSREADPAVHA
jgi:glycosyltransferase involved in cell wall biosynthesis